MSPAGNHLWWNVSEQIDCDNLMTFSTHFVETVACYLLLSEGVCTSAYCGDVSSCQLPLKIKIGFHSNGQFPRANICKNIQIKGNHSGTSHALMRTTCQSAWALNPAVTGLPSSCNLGVSPCGNQAQDTGTQWILTPGWRWNAARSSVPGWMWPLLLPANMAIRFSSWRETPGGDPHTGYGIHSLSDTGGIF